MKILKHIAILSLALLLVGCGSGPRATAKMYTENLWHGKISEAKKYATEQTGKLIDVASSMIAMPIDPDFRFNFIEEIIDGNKATVTYKKPGGETDNVNLVKIDNKWKVHLVDDENMPQTALQKKNECINNMRRIEISKDMYALETNCTNGWAFASDEEAFTAFVGKEFLKDYCYCPTSTSTEEKGTLARAVADYKVNPIGSNVSCKSRITGKNAHILK